jgi:hypothetical protein
MGLSVPWPRIPLEERLSLGRLNNSIIIVQNSLKPATTMKAIQLMTLGLLVAALCATSPAHPVPDIPVRSTFGLDGKVTVLIEIDPRCFEGDALHAPYLENAAFQLYSKAQKTKLKEQAKNLIEGTIEFDFEPKSDVAPAFEMSFTTFSSKPLKWNTATPKDNNLKCAETPVMVTAMWATDASKLTGYRIKAKKTGKFSVKFINHLGKEKQRLHVLFPGETSYRLDLKDWAAQSSAAPPDSPEH